MALLLLTLLSTISLILSDNPKCTRVNEVFGCARPCDPTCTNPRPATCNVACRPGCVCAKGYLRNSRGECVPREKCIECNIERLQEYTTCGSNCPSCQNSRQICPKICGSGCFCIREYRKNSWNQCIAVEKCESCLENEEFREGLSACPATCEDPNPPLCPPLISINGCSCIEGYVRGPNNKCIPLKDCPKS